MRRTYYGLPEYFYHGTKRENLREISIYGLLSNYRERNDDENYDSDDCRRKQHLLYATLEDVREWGHKTAQLRFSRDAIPRDISYDYDKFRPGEVYLFGDEEFGIASEDLEIFRRGKWCPLLGDKR